MHKNRRPDKERISIDELRKRFIYHNGELRRMVNGVGTGGKTGGVQSLGYHRIKIDGKHYFTHHLVWAFHNGRWPIEIDHIDRDKLNNRIENLRECTRKENQTASFGKSVVRSDGRVFASLSLAAEFMGVSQKTIRNAAMGRTKQSKTGYAWSFT